MSPAGVVTQEYELVPVDVLQPHPRNVNEGDIGAVIESIRANRFFGAVVVQRSSSFILAGKHRWLAAKECGLLAIPTIWVDVDDAEALRIMLVDNRASRLGHDDPERLAELLQEMLASTGSLTGTGFTGDDLDEMLVDLEKAAIDAQSAQGVDETERLKERFQVLVGCQGETQQGALLERLMSEGYQCRALIS